MSDAHNWPGQPRPAGDREPDSVGNSEPGGASDGASTPGESGSGPSSWDRPSYPQAGYGQSGSEPSGYPQPGYPQPGYQQPGYQKPGYQQPGYGTSDPSIYGPTGYGYGYGSAGGDQTQVADYGNYGNYGGAYAPPAGAYGAPGGYGPPGPPQTKRSGAKIALVISLVVVVVAGLAVGGFFLFRSSPAVTWQGKDIANADTVLSTTEQKVFDVVAKRKGARSNDTRCYFAVPKAKPASGKATDVTDALYCGPVLFVDGDAAKQYLAFRLSSSGEQSGKQNLSAGDSPSSADPVAVPGDDKLVRPDARSAPTGNGGLTVPAPPPADKDVLAQVTDADIADAPSGTAIGALDAGVRIGKLGEIKRYGKGDAARSAPQGQKLIGFALGDSAGDTNNNGASSLGLKIVVDGGTGRDVPAPTGTNVVAVPTSAKTVELVTGANGVNQSLSLLDGKPGAGNLAVLARANRFGSFTPPAGLTFTESASGASASRPVTLAGSNAGLFYWADPAGTAPASAPNRAFLKMDLKYTFTTSSPPPFTGGNAGDSSTFQPSFLSITLADGSKVAAAVVANYIAFQVPADFTKGTVTIAGAYTNGNGVTFTVQSPVSFDVSIAIS